MSGFWTRNSAKHSVSSMFSRSNLACELCGKSGFLERQLSHKTKNSSSEITLPSYASNSISLVSRKDIFHKGFLKLSRQVSKGLPSQKTSLLKFGSWRERRRPLTQACSFVDVAVAPKTSGA